MPANPYSEISAYTKVVALKGPATASAIDALARLAEVPQLELLKDTPVVPPVPPALFAVIAEALKDGWDDLAASRVIAGISKRVREGAVPDTQSLNRWLRVHRGAPEPVLDCLSVEPPLGFAILQLLSRAGSQKVVYVATWDIAQREVVLKRFLGAESSARRLFAREMQPHPLSMVHPNIIETHSFANASGEPFLVERKLPVVLNDSSDLGGSQEAANLLRDIANALAFLHDRTKRIHGDIKPDNIGFEDGRFILLDFGICRPEEAFVEDTSATGSIRTRAPELLEGGGRHTSASDVWSLAATVFNVLVHRFPLFGKGETPPRVSHPAERADFEKVLANRIETEWQQYVDVTLIPEPLRAVLAPMLERAPASRPTAKEIVSKCETELAALLRGNGSGDWFSPSDEIEQLMQYLPESSILRLMPYGDRQALRERLDRLDSYKALSAEQRKAIATLKHKLG